MIEYYMSFSYSEGRWTSCKEKESWGFNRNWYDTDGTRYAFKILSLIWCLKMFPTFLYSMYMYMQCMKCFKAAAFVCSIWCVSDREPVWFRGVWQCREPDQYHNHQLHVWGLQIHVHCTRILNQSVLLINEIPHSTTCKSFVYPSTCDFIYCLKPCT